MVKNNPAFSKRFAIIAIVSAALIGFIGWVGLKGGHPPAVQPGVVASTASNSAAPTEAVIVSDAPVLPDGELPPVIPIPLAPVLVDAENSTWLKDKDYLVAPHTEQEFGGVTLLMDGMVQLQGSVSRDDKKRAYRSSVTIPLNLTNQIGCLYLLGATRYGTRKEKCSDLVWHFTDGSSERTPIEEGNQFRDWVRNPYEQPTHLPYAFSKVVWAAPQPSQPTHILRLYRATIANPQPTKILKNLEFVSALEDPTLFIVGLTLDPLKIGERPDSSPDLEGTDAIPPKSVQIAVQDFKGQPIPHAKLGILFRQRNGKSTYNSTTSVDTSDAGIASVDYPPQDLDRLQVSASHEDYASQQIRWDLQTGNTVPAAYTLKLNPDVKIGAIVVNQDDLPVSDCKVELHRFWTGSDDYNQAGDHADFPSQTVTTDANGKWQAKGLPPEMLDRIEFDLKPTDFLGTNIIVGSNPQTEQQLRDGTFKIVLIRGLIVNGQVTDENDTPVSNATVWVGRKYFRDRQETKSDEAGKFDFHSVSPGETLFSVIASGRSPESKTVTVTPTMSEVVFRLKPGYTIRAHIQDESGQPIAGARIDLEGNPGEPAYDAYNFSTTSDGQGDFIWDGAPETPMPFYIYASGFEAKRDFNLTPSQDNIVTLAPSRQLEGLVLDDATGQPVTKFAIRIGHAKPGDTGANLMGALQNRAYNGAMDGKFIMDLNEDDANAAAVSGDDYLEKLQMLPEPQNGTIQMTFHLKRSEGVSGTVTDPAGNPLVGVNVAAVGGQSGSTMQLKGTRLESWDERAKVVTTDSNGKFTVPSPTDGSTIIAVGSAGFGAAPLEQVRASGVLVLQPFGRIEGTLKIGRSPAPGKDLIMSLNLPVSLDWDTYKRTTDEEGKFTYDRAPAGHIGVERLIQTQPNNWSYSHNTPVTVEPGKTSYVTLGDTGGIVHGSVRLETPPLGDEVLTISGSMNSATPVFASSAEASAFYQQQKRFTVVVGADNTFMVDSVDPGSYTLRISAYKKGDKPWTSTAVAMGQTTVVVPDNVNPFSVISAGEVVLKPMPQK